MQKRAGRLVFSPSDLIVFLESPFASWMDRLHVERRGTFVPDAPDPQMSIAAKMGIAHETHVLSAMRGGGRQIWQPETREGAFEETLDAMHAGFDIIYQAALRDGDFEGDADFLRRVPGDSALGHHRYEIIDTKLARKPKPYFLLQLCAYAAMLENVQGIVPEHVHIITGDGVEHAFRHADYVHYFRALRDAFLEAQARFDPDAPPTPAARAEHRRWATHAARILEELDHPSRVANITSVQVKRLANAGIHTLTLLGHFERSHRMHVSGGPGTGKTLLSRALCERRGPALYLCWTSALAATMRASGIEQAWTIREYAAQLLNQAAVPIASGEPRSAWTQDTWDNIALQAAIDAAPTSQDHRIVVVDEAQDFAESEWELVEALAGDGPLWAFGDRGQSFWAERGVPKRLFGAQFELTTRYRSPEALAAFADLYRPEGAGQPVTKCTELRVVSVAGDVLSRVKLEVAKALKDGARPGDIAVLSLVGQTRSALCKLDRLGDVPVARADAPGTSSKVIADPLLRFKGLDRPYVIVTELAASAARYDVRMHVALTRATVGCVVVGSEEEIARDTRLVAR